MREVFNRGLIDGMEDRRKAFTWAFLGVNGKWLMAMGSRHLLLERDRSTFLCRWDRGHGPIQRYGVYIVGRLQTCKLKFTWLNTTHCNRTLRWFRSEIDEIPRLVSLLQFKCQLVRC
jgi:hypothetical protein